MFFELTGTIRNLGIKNATITGWSTSGIADSITEKGVIENCFVQAILTNTNSTESYAAGIASSINKNAKIINTYFYGQKHISSGLYIITGEQDSVDSRGYTTTLSLTRIGEDK